MSLKIDFYITKRVYKNLKMYFNNIVNNFKDSGTEGLFIFKQNIKKFGNGKERIVIVFEANDTDKDKKSHSKFENLGNSTLYFSKITSSYICSVFYANKKINYLPSSILYYSNADLTGHNNKMNVCNLPNKLKVLNFYETSLEKIITPLNLHKLVISLSSLLKIDKKSKITVNKICMNEYYCNTDLTDKLKIKTKKVKKYYRVTSDNLFFSSLKEENTNLKIQYEVDKNIFSEKTVIKNNGDFINKSKNIKIKRASFYEGFFDCTLKKKHINKEILNNLNNNEKKFINRQTFINQLLKNETINNLNMKCNSFIQIICYCFITYFIFNDIIEQSIYLYYNFKIYDTVLYNLQIISIYILKTYYLTDVFLRKFILKSVYKLIDNANYFICFNKEADKFNLFYFEKNDMDKFYKDTDKYIIVGVSDKNNCNKNVLNFIKNISEKNIIPLVPVSISYWSLIIKSINIVLVTNFLLRSNFVFKFIIFFGSSLLLNVINIFYYKDMDFKF